jgi:hypothetical protein
MELCQFIEKSLEGGTIWKATLATTHEPLQAQNHETLYDIELLQPYPIVVDDALLEIQTTVISAVVCRSMSNYHGQTLPLSLNVVTSRCSFVLLGTSFLPSWPSNQGDRHLFVMVKAGSVYLLYGSGRTIDLNVVL